MISYSDATVPSSNRAVKDLIRFFKIPSAGVWSWFCKLPLFNTIINGKNLLILSGTRNQTNQTGPIINHLSESRLALSSGQIILREGSCHGRPLLPTAWAEMDANKTRGSRRPVACSTAAPLRPALAAPPPTPPGPAC